MANNEMIKMSMLVGPMIKSFNCQTSSKNDSLLKTFIHYMQDALIIPNDVHKIYTSAKSREQHTVEKYFKKSLYEE